MNESAAKDPAFDAIKYKQHARQIVCPDGKVRTEKRPIVKSARMVDPAGNVCWVPLYAGPMQMSEADPYRVSIQIYKARDGWIGYGECPKNSGAARHLPDEMRSGGACAAGTKGVPNPENHNRMEPWHGDPCKCVLAIIAARQAVQAKKMLAIQGNAKTVADEQLEETRKLNAALVASLTAAKSEKNERGGR